MVYLRHRHRIYGLYKDHYKRKRCFENNTALLSYTNT